MSINNLPTCYLDPGSLSGERDLWLDLLMSHVVEQQPGAGSLCFVYSYPISQVAVARVPHEDVVGAGQRFELYVDSVELANGYKRAYRRSGAVSAFRARQCSVSGTRPAGSPGG